jgi:hypothetical protein
LEGFRWTKETGVTSIGFLPRFGSTVDFVTPTSISDSGIIVGYQYGALPLPLGTPIGGITSNDRAFIWMEGAGMMDLREMLITSGLDMSDWALLTRATDISADGTTIIGTGRRSNGLEEAFVLRNNDGTSGWRIMASGGGNAAIPEPSTMLLLSLGIGMATWQRRRLRNVR